MKSDRLKVSDLSLLITGVVLLPCIAVYAVCKAIDDAIDSAFEEEEGSTAEAETEADTVIIQEQQA